MVKTNTISKTDQILLFICGDSSKLNFKSKYASKLFRQKGNKIELKSFKSKELRKDIKVLSDLYKSMSLPYPIAAKYISQALDIRGSTVGKLLIDLKKDKIVIQRKNGWSISIEENAIKNIVKRVYKHFGIFIGTVFFQDYLFSDTQSIIKSSLDKIPNLTNDKLDFSFIKKCPIFTFNIISKRGFSREEIENIYKYMFKYIFCDSKNKKFWYKEIIYYCILYYYQIRYNDEFKIKDGNYLKIMDELQAKLRHYIEIVDNKHVN